MLVGWLCSCCLGVLGVLSVLSVLVVLACLRVCLCVVRCLFLLVVLFDSLLDDVVGLSRRKGILQQYFLGFLYYLLLVFLRGELQHGVYIVNAGVYDHFFVVCGVVVQNSA